jgi:type II secretory pathway pseudopilin PulG
MQDFKQYLPHHREQQEPQLLDKANKLLVLAMMVGIIGLMVFTFWQGLYQEAELAHAVAESRKKERQRIYTANQDILAGHEAYIKQMDALIDKAYRQGR